MFDIIISSRRKESNENEKEGFGLKNDICRLVFGDSIRFALSDGTDTRNRLDALPYAHSRTALRIYMRLAVGLDGRRGCSCLALTDDRRIPTYVSHRRLHGF